MRELTYSGTEVSTTYRCVALVSLTYSDFLIAPTRYTLEGNTVVSKMTIRERRVTPPFPTPIDQEPSRLVALRMHRHRVCTEVGNFGYTRIVHNLDVSLEEILLPAVDIVELRKE